MAEAHEDANSGEDSATRAKNSDRWAWARPSRTDIPVYVGVGILLSALLCVVLLWKAFRDPSLSDRLLAAEYCFVAIPTMIYNGLRVYWVKKPPTRWQSNDPRVRLVKVCKVLVGVALIGVFVGMFAKWNVSASDELYGIFLALSPLQWCFSGFLTDRMPLPPTLPTPDPTKPEAPMKPIHSDHWGKREAP